MRTEGAMMSKRRSLLVVIMSTLVVSAPALGEVLATEDDSAAS